MDSRTVCRCSAAFRRICSRMMSAFSRSTRARAFDSASMRRSSFLCLSSISCSIVAVKKGMTQQVHEPPLNMSESSHKRPCRECYSGDVYTFPHGLLFLYRLLLFAKVLLIQGLLLKKEEKKQQSSFWSHFKAFYTEYVGDDLTCCRSWSSYRCLASLS